MPINVCTIEATKRNAKNWGLQRDVFCIIAFVIVMLIAMITVVLRILGSSIAIGASTQYQS